MHVRFEARDREAHRTDERSVLLCSGVPSKLEFIFKIKLHYIKYINENELMEIELKNKKIRRTRYDHRNSS